MNKSCLGLRNVGTQTPVVKQCPQGGLEVEFFSDEQQVRCSVCGAVVRK
ncbi:MAG: hypothetical protein JW945_08010 [Methanomicrobia archaeon]|nr:hypothetical protein [Methanomicrobia archaeon]